MAIQFVIGRAGSGKTHRCFNAIVEELRRRPIGPTIYWLLPRQATFSAERLLTTASGLGGFCRARVLSFEELGREVLEGCGGAHVPEITSSGRRMILGHLLRETQPQLRFFGSVARQPGLAAKLDATFAELEQAGKDPADLDTLAKRLASEADTQGVDMLDKVHDLRLIYGRYTEYLGQETLDQHRRLLQVLGCIKQSKLFPDSTVYVDGFAEFSEYERRVLAELGCRCRRVEVMLTLDPKSAVLKDPHLFPEELSLFHPVEMTYRSLYFVLKQEQAPIDHPPIALIGSHRSASKNLAAVERELFDRAIVVSKREHEGVELLESSTRRAEVDAAARRIRALLAKGYRMREIAVLVRDLPAYYSLLDESFREHGIAYFADRRRTIAHHPLPQLVRSLLLLAHRPWSHELMMALLKSGLVKVSPAAADAIENYVLRHRIRGDAWASAKPWSYHQPVTAAPQSSQTPGDVEPPNTHQVDGNRRAFVESLLPFVVATRTPGSVRAVSIALFQTLERLEVRAQITHWMSEARAAGLLEQLSEHQQVWKELTSFFQQLVELLGDEVVTAEAFLEIIESGLEGFELALTPPTVDQVLVGQVDRTRPQSPRAVLLLGMNEGVFPKVPAEDSVFSNAERRELQTHDMPMQATDRRLLNETFLAYTACASPSELLYVSRALSTDAGKPLAESIYFRRLRQLFPLPGTLTRVPLDDRDDVAFISTPRQLVTSVMRWARDQMTAGPTGKVPTSPDAIEGPFAGPLAAIYQWLATRSPTGDMIDRVKAVAWKSLSYDNAAKLSPQTAGRLFPAPLHAAANRLEIYAACPFQHFVRYGLHLEGRRGDDGISAMDLGNVFHHVLDHVVRGMLRGEKQWSDLNRMERKKAIHYAALDIAGKLRGEILLSSARNRYLLQRIELTLEQVISSQAAFSERGQFEPAFGKVRFGDAAMPTEFSIATPGGSSVFLSGSIDRVDLLEGADLFAAIDYRVGSHQLQLDHVYHGLTLQLLTSLLVLERHSEALAGRRLIPAAAFYVQTLRQIGSVDHPSEAIGPEDPRFDLQVKPRGLISTAHAREFDTALQGGATSDVIHARLIKDGSFGSKSRSDLAEPAEFRALLDWVATKLGVLADGISSGDISVRPFMIRSETPCPRCEYRDICRFTPSQGGYRVLQPIPREEVLKRVTEATEPAGGVG